MTKFYFFLLSATLLTAGCRTAVKSYNKGDYASAVELGVKKLSKDPSDTETKALIKQAYSLAVNEGEDAIRALSGSADVGRYEAILSEYNRLQNLYDAVRQSAVATQLLQPVNYSGYIETYRDKVAGIYIDNAEKWMDDGTKKSYREAYYQYSKALRFTSSPDVQRRRDEAYDAALTKILVVPIQNQVGYGYNSSYQLEQFQNGVVRSLESSMSNDFVRFYSDWDLRVNQVTPDEILEMNMGRISIGRPYDERSVQEVSKQVVVKEVVYRPDSVVKQYGTVKATITTTHRTLLSEGELYLTLRDVQGRILWNDRFTGQHRWETRFATYTGDERALSDNDKASLNHQQTSYNAPSDDDIMRELYRQIQSDMCYRLRSYFTRY